MSSHGHGPFGPGGVTAGELSGLLCNYISEIVPHRMNARSAGAHLAHPAAIKARFERSGRPDPTARGINPAVRNTLDGAARRYPAVTTRCRPYTLRMLDAVVGLARDAGAPRRCGRGPRRLFGARRGDERGPSSPGQHGIRDLALGSMQFELMRGRAGRARVHRVSCKNGSSGRSGAVRRSLHRVRCSRRRRPAGPDTLARASRAGASRPACRRPLLPARRRERADARRGGEVWCVPRRAKSASRKVAWRCTRAAPG